MKFKILLAIVVLNITVAKSQLLSNTEFTLSPFVVHTLGMNSSMDYQYGLRSDIMTYGGAFINGINAFAEDGAKIHPYYSTYPNPDKDNNSYETILKNTKSKFELGYFYPIQQLNKQTRVLARCGYYNTRSAFAIADASEKNDGTGPIKNPFYALNIQNPSTRINFGPFGQKNVYETGYGIMHSNGTFLGLSLNRVLDESSQSLQITYELYSDLYLGKVAFDDVYSSGAAYHLYNDDVSNLGYRFGINMKIPAEKMVGFFCNMEFGKMPGYSGLGETNQRGYFQFQFGAAVNLSAENISNLNPF